MGCMDNACPVIAVPKEDWELTDPKVKDLQAVRLIRYEINRRVIELIKSLGITPRI
jgi:hypothetical protein